jgi:hypothetical protein
MDDPGKFANDEHRRVWAAIRDVSEPLYLLVGKRSGAQAHLRGSFAVKTIDGEDLIVLEGTDTHVHVNWSEITEIERAERDGYDCIGFLGRQGPVVEVLAGSPEYRFGAELLAAIEQSNRG